MLVDVHGRPARRCEQRIETPPPGMCPKAWALHIALSLAIPASSPQGAAFAPTSIPNLKAWYRGDLGITLNGGDVAAWADQSGSGDANRHAVQSNAALQPLYVASNSDFAGKPTLRFSRSNGDYLLTGTWSAAQSQPTTIYAVYKAGTNTFARTVCDGLAGGARNVLQNEAATGQPGMFAGGSFIRATTDKSSTKIYACCVFNGVSSSLYVDNFATAAATGNPDTNGIAGLVIGTDVGKVNAVDGDIAEIAVFAGAHDSATRALMQAYFARYT